MADSIGGYPTGPFERFVTGFQTGWEKMTDLRQKADALEMQLATNKQRRENAANYGGGGSDTGSSATREDPYATGTTGSGGDGGGGGGGGGGGSLGDMSQTGVGHVATKEERMNYYNKINEDNKWGLNMHAIAQLVATEGGNKYTGDNGHSHGDFQLYDNGGMGNDALRAKIDIYDPKTWQQQGFFAMQQMAQHKNDPSWFAGQWHGPRDHAPWAVQNYSNPTATPPRGMLSYVPPAAPAPAPAAAPTATASAPAPSTTPAIGSSTPAPAADPYNIEQQGGPALAAPAAPAPTAALAPAAPVGRPGASRVWNPNVKAYINPLTGERTPGPPPAPADQQSALPASAGPVMAAELAQRPTFGQLAQLAQQYLPVAKAALMPTNSGLYG